MEHDLVDQTLLLESFILQQRRDVRGYAEKTQSSVDIGGQIWVGKSVWEYSSYRKEQIRRGRRDMTNSFRTVELFIKI